MDQTFPGWHELTVCYKNQGWTLVPNGRLVRSAPYDSGEEIEEGVPTPEWEFVEARFEKQSTGEKGYLLFCFCDGRGLPFDAPPVWGGVRSFLERFKNRIGYQYRSRLFRGEAYQMQVFIPTRGHELPEEYREMVKSQFMVIREKLRSKLMEKSAKEFDEELTTASVSTDD